MQPDTTTIIDLCSSSSKRLVLRRFLLHEAVSTTGFNALAQDHLASNLTTAINKMTSDKNQQFRFKHGAPGNQSEKYRQHLSHY